MTGFIGHIQNLGFSSFLKVKPSPCEVKCKCKNSQNHKITPHKFKIQNTKYKGLQNSKAYKIQRPTILKAVQLSLATILKASNTQILAINLKFSKRLPLQSYQTSKSKSYQPKGIQKGC